MTPFLWLIAGAAFALVLLVLRFIGSVLKAASDASLDDEGLGYGAEEEAALRMTSFETATARKAFRTSPIKGTWKRACDL